MPESRWVAGADDVAVSQGAILSEAASQSSRQWTLAAPISFTGVGLHSGEPVNVRILPAPENHGLVFLREDLPGRPRIPALVEHVVDTTLCTTLGRGQATVRTVEHVLGALYAMGITNALLAVDGPEVPALDGSALAYARAIHDHGIQVQEAPRKELALTTRVEVGVGDKSLLFLPGEVPQVTYIVDYGHPLAGAQCWEGVVDPATFRQELAAARTFCLKVEADRMRQAGLARGGSFENAVVVLDDGYSSPLRFPDEFVRHKVLDLLGDLALIGATWRGHIVAAKAGHPLHVQLASQLRPFVLGHADSSVKEVLHVR